MKLETPKAFRMLVCGQILQEINRRNGTDGLRIPSPLIEAVETAFSFEFVGEFETISPSKCYTEYRSQWLRMLDLLAGKVLELEKSRYNTIRSRIRVEALHSCIRKALRSYNEALTVGTREFRLYQELRGEHIIAAYSADHAAFYGADVKDGRWRLLTSTAELEDVCSKALENPHVPFKRFGQHWLGTTTKLSRLGSLS